jgi:rod shape-determining protein MreC
MVPRDALYTVGDYFTSVTTLQRENRKLKERQLGNAQTLQQAQQLLAENEQLRRLLAANERVPVKSVMSEILYDARDAYTRKIVVDRGSQHGVAPGQPVIDDVGVVGQVTRVFPFTSEVTLLTDKDQAIPVQVVRSGLRSIAYGQGHSGSLDLRFMPTNADVKDGDVLVTSGIDGVYPPGLAVAKVTRVENKSGDAFARISCQPMAGIDRNRQLLILLAENKFPPPPPQEETKDGKKDKGKKRMSEVKDPKKEPAKADDAANKPAAVPAGGAAPAATTPAAAPAPTAAPTAAPGAAAVNATKPVAPMPAAQQKPAAAPAPSKPAPARPVAVTPAQPAKPAQKEAIKEGLKGATP